MVKAWNLGLLGLRLAFANFARSHMGAPSSPGMGAGSPKRSVSSSMPLASTPLNFASAPLGE